MIVRRPTNIIRNIPVFFSSWSSIICDVQNIISLHLMNVNNHIICPKRALNWLFQRLNALNFSTSSLVYWHIQMNREFYTFFLESFFSFRKFSFSFFFIVKTILSIVEVYIFPLISIASHFFFHKFAEALTICLNKSRWNVEIAEHFRSPFFTINLWSISRSVECKTQSLTEIFIHQSFLCWWFLCITWLSCVIVRLTINVHPN